MSTGMSDDASASIEELKRLLGVETDAELADALELQKSAIAQWRRRNRVPTHVTVRIENKRRQTQALARGEYEDAFPAVVGHHGLMVALLLTPSLCDLKMSGKRREEHIVELNEAASWFTDLRLFAALALVEIMRNERIDVHDAFERLVGSRDRLADIRKRAFGLPQ